MLRRLGMYRARFREPRSRLHRWSAFRRSTEKNKSDKLDYARRRPWRPKVPLAEKKIGRILLGFVVPTTWLL